MAYDVTEERLKVKGSEQITRDLKVGRDLETTNSITIGSRLANCSVGNKSFAFGENVAASGNDSYAGGYRTSAIGYGSHAEGNCTYACGNYSHAEGWFSKACGLYSHAEGLGSIAKFCSAHAEGYSTCTNGDAAHAEGGETQALGQFSHAEGCSSSANGWASHVEGYKTSAYGCNSHAEGEYTDVNSRAGHVQGKYNYIDSQCCFADIVGGGDSTTRLNIEATDWNGNKFLKGDVFINANNDSTGGTALGATLTCKVYCSSVGVANGVASLDATGRVPYSQLPESAMEYKGTWDASTNTPSLADGIGTNGDFYVVSVAGTVNFGTVENPRNVTFYVNDRVIYDGTISQWARLPAGEVRSVNGMSGDVVLDATNINYNGNTTVKCAIDTAETNAKNLANATGTLGIAHGGTGATTAADARTCLGLGNVSTINTNNCTTQCLRGDGTWAAPSNLASCADCGKNGSSYSAFGSAAFYNKKAGASGVTYVEYSGANGSCLLAGDFLAYWNGAYNSTGNSNLRYFCGGTFGTAAACAATAFRASDWTPAYVGRAGSVDRTGYTTAYDFDVALTNGSTTATGTTSYVSNSCRLRYCNTTGALRITNSTDSKIAGSLSVDHICLNKEGYIVAPQCLAITTTPDSTSGLVTIHGRASQAGRVYICANGAKVAETIITINGIDSFRLDCSGTLHLRHDRTICYDL